VVAGLDSGDSLALLGRVDDGKEVFVMLPELAGAMMREIYFSESPS